MAVLLLRTVFPGRSNGSAAGQDKGFMAGWIGKGPPVNLDTGEPACFRNWQNCPILLGLSDEHQIVHDLRHRRIRHENREGATCNGEQQFGTSHQVHGLKSILESG
jgi:hypothetical protein